MNDRSREQLLREMGLGPVWVRRESDVSARPPSEEPLSIAERASIAVPDDSSPAARVEARPPSAPIGAPSPVRETSDARPVLNPSGLDWAGLEAAIRSCQGCALCEHRQQAVPGVGDIGADWLFIGEGPGAEEDERGEPFVGQAGRLLDAMLAAINLKRGTGVYIANAVKCRPPSNRTPEAGELAACRPYLARQIALIRPRLIVLLGRVAVQSVLGDDASLASLRGKTMHYRDDGLDIPVRVTYHPAYLLRNLPDKAKAWEDLCAARALMRVVREEVG